MASSDQRSTEQAARWRPDIEPDSREWTTVQTKFDKLIADHAFTLDGILKKHFTSNERDLLLPATSPGYLVDIQRRNTRLYNQLLRGRLKGVKSTLSTKLTMMYFGLPIEPMHSDLFTDLDADVEMFDRADANNYEVQPPLHFLTAHDQRNWGKDDLRGREAPFSCIPVPADHIAPLRYNGQRLNKPPGESNVMDSSSQNAGRSALRGGGRGDPPHKTGTGDFIRPEDARDANPQGPWLWMAGYQGGYPLLGSNTKSISTAIRRLLSLGMTEAADIVLTQYHASTLEKGAVIHASLPLQANSAVYTTLRNHIKQSKTLNHDDCCIWFIHRKGELSPEDSLGPDPALFESSQIVLLEGDAVEHHSPHQTCAYFRLPLGFPLTKVCGSNTYAPFLRTALQVILGTAEEPRSSHFSVSIGNKDGVDALETYGGLNPAKSTVRLFRASAVDEHETALPWKVRAKSLDQTSLAFYLHGYDSVRGRDYEVVNDRLAVPHNHNVTLSDNLSGLSYGEAFITMNEMLKAWASHDHLQHIKCVNIWLGRDVWAETAHLANEYERAYDVEYRPFEWSVTGGARAEPDWALGLAKFLESAAKKGERSFVLQPVFETYELLHRVGRDLKSLDPDPDPDSPPWPEWSLKEFREAVSALWRQSLPDPSKYWISLTGLSVDEKHDNAGDMFVVSPETTENEWVLIQLQLTSPKIVVDVSSHGVADYARNLEKSPWGPRYGLVQDLKFIDRIGAAPDNAEKVLDPEQLKDDPPTLSSQIAAETAQERQRFLDSDLPGLRRRLQRRHSEGNDSWERRPSIFKNYPAPVSIPVDAAPAEHMMRTGGAGVPMVITHVQTPSEQARLEKALEDSRGGQLRRLMSCHYKDCGFTCGARDTEAMRKHIADVHEATKCPWCSDRLFRHQGLVAREEHIFTKHAHRLAEAARFFGLDLNAGAGRQSGLDPIDYEVSPPRSPEQDKSAAPARTPLPKQPSMVGRGPRFADSEGLAEEDEYYRRLDRRTREEEGGAQVRQSTSPTQPTRLNSGSGARDQGGEGGEGGLTAAEEARAWIEAEAAASRKRKAVAMEEDTDDSDVAATEEAAATRTKIPAAKRKRTAGRDSAYRDEGDDTEDDEDPQVSTSPVGKRPPTKGTSTNTAQRKARTTTKATTAKKSALQSRADSADSEESTAADDPNYKPDPDMYCSRCLRKRPRSSKNVDKSWEEQMEAHMDPNLGCRIRRGEGTTVDLPNRSGWVRIDPKGPKKLTDYKKDFLKEYPGYSRTIYPAGGGTGNSNVWTQDPNNKEYNDGWKLPWPPSKTDGANGGGGGGGARKGAGAAAGKGKAGGSGAAYKDAPAENSEDEEPDPEAVERDAAGRGGRPKRTRAGKKRRTS